MTADPGETPEDVAREIVWGRIGIFDSELAAKAIVEIASALRARDERAVSDEREEITRLTRVLFWLATNAGGMLTLPLDVLRSTPPLGELEFNEDAFQDAIIIRAIRARS